MQEIKKIMDPKIDFTFKQVFGQDTKECKKILLHLLNSTFERKGSKRIKEVTYINTNIDREFESDKESVMDIAVKTEDDETIDIEMQVGGAYAYKKRSIYNCTRLYSRQITKGTFYNKLKRCVCVSILNFNLITETEDFHSVFEVKERHKNFTLSDDVEWHFIEVCKLPEFNVLDGDINNLDYLQKWALFFKYAPDENMRWLIEQLRHEVEEIDMAGDILERVSQDERAWFIYESRRKELMDKLTLENYVKENEAEYKAAKEKLLETKEKLGQTESKLGEAESKLGEAESKLGEAESKLGETESKLDETKSKLETEINKKKQAVKNMLLDGVSIDIVKKYFNLSVDEIMKIKEEG